MELVWKKSKILPKSKKSGYVAYSAETPVGRYVLYFDPVDGLYSWSWNGYEYQGYSKKIGFVEARSEAQNHWNQLLEKLNVRTDR